jgi:GH15 family glucan-1,4-alpha-glucosidase
VLVTRFLCAEGVGEVIDYMPLGTIAERNSEHWIIRHVRVAHGRMAFRLDCQPAFNYARDPHLTRISASGAVFDSEDLSLALSSSVPLERKGRGVTCEFTLDEEQECIFLLRDVPRGAECPPPPPLEQATESFDATIEFWRKWLSQCTYKGRWREMVERSALALKLMTFAPTGAIVAAPTCSLPESIGGGRNWDYRYTWLRDAAFTVYGLMRIGFTCEAAAFMHWIEARCAGAVAGRVASAGLSHRW